MTGLFQTESPVVRRSRSDLVIAGACISAVAVGLLFKPIMGRCGTAHYLVFQMLAAMLRSLAEEFWVSRRLITLEHVAAYALNVVLFAAIFRGWYTRASEGRYVIGALVLAAGYLLSYFLLLPSAGCP